MMKVEVIKQAEAEDVWVVGDHIRFRGGLAGSDLQMIEVEVPVGSGTPPHRHASAEMFYVIDGTLTVGCFPEAGAPTMVEAGKGSTIRIESWAAHNYSNTGDKPVQMLVMIEPSMIAFFKDVGTAEPQSQPDFGRIGAAMQAHGIEMAA
jgi:quercetin dioxygenase-like cupin family protein